MKIFNVAFFDENGNLISKFIAARNKAKVRAAISEKSSLSIFEYTPKNLDIFYNNLTEEEKEQFIKAFVCYFLRRTK